MELKDYYFILGVPRTATARDILHAYRELAKLYHPDRVGPQGTATFQDIVEAYEVLSDPERRRHYTESLSQFVDVTASAPPVGSARPEPLIPDQRRFRLYSQPEPLVPEPMSLFADFGTISPSVDALYDHLLQNFTERETSKAVQLASLTVEVRLSPMKRPRRHGAARYPGVCALCRLWWLWTRLVYAVPVLPRPRHGRDRAHGPRADTTTGAGGNDGGGACTPARDSQCLCACAHPHHVVRSIVGGRFTRCKCRPVSAWRVAGWRMGVDGSLRASRDRTKGKGPEKNRGW